jgi:hypothetical protein
MAARWRFWLRVRKLVLAAPPPSSRSILGLASPCVFVTRFWKPDVEEFVCCTRSLYAQRREKAPAQRPKCSPSRRCGQVKSTWTHERERADRWPATMAGVAVVWLCVPRLTKCGSSAAIAAADQSAPDCKRSRDDIIASPGPSVKSLLLLQGLKAGELSQACCAMTAPASARTSSTPRKADHLRSAQTHWRS